MSIKLTKNQLIASCERKGIILDIDVKYKNRDLIKLLGNVYLSELDKEDLSWGLDRRLDLESLSLCYRYDELKPDQQDELWGDNYIAETKLNGCFEGGTLITLEDGSQKTIKDIVDNKLEVKVLSYNEITKKLESKRVVNWFNNGSKQFKEWVHIRAGSAKNTKSTLDHKFYNNGTNTWVPASGMAIGDRVLKVVNNFNNVQREVIAGMLLGDTCLQRDKRHLNSYRLVTSHSEKQKDYFDKKYECLSNFLSKPTKYTSGYGSVCYRAVSKALPEAEHYTKVYFKVKEGIKTLKVISKEYLDMLTPLSLAIWFMDDGNRKRSYLDDIRIVNKFSRATLATHAFTYESVVLLSEYLSGRGYTNSVLDHKGMFYICINSEGSQLFFKDIAPYILESMNYKLPDECRVLPKINWYTNQKPSPFLYEASIDYKKECKDMSRTYGLVTAYDIEVEGNHNYFANNTLVHNCRLLLTFHPDEGFRFFSRHVSVQDYLPIDYSNNIYLKGFNSGLDLVFKGSTVPYVRDVYHLLGKDYVGIKSTLKNDIFASPFILDCEVVASGNVNTNELLKYGGNITESEQNATSTLLSLSPDTSRRLQIEQNVTLQFYPFDCLYMGDGWVKDRPYEERYIFLRKIRSLLREYFDVMDVPRYFTKEEKESAWKYQLDNKGEGLVFKNITKPYQATEARKNDVQIKLKRSMSNGSLEKGEDIDAFISGYVKPDPKRGLSEYIGGIKFSVILRTLDGEEVEHHLATVSGIPLELRKAMTVYDKDNKPVLNSEYLDKVCVIDGMSVSPKSLRFSHARSKFDFRSDKTKYDCILSELFLRSNII